MGMKAEGKDLKKDPEKQGFLRMIFSLRSEKLSYAKIAKKLNELGIPSPQGKKWGAQTIHYICGNPIYTGLLSFNGFESRREELAI